MTPPCKAFDASELQLHVQADLTGKKRKLQGGGDVDLSKCALRAMTQFRCVVEKPEVRDSPVGCYPLQRFFRQCQDRKGTFTVETTAWEGMSAEAKLNPRISAKRPDAGIGKEKGKDNGNGHQLCQQWSQAWEDE